MSEEQRLAAEADGLVRDAIAALADGDERAAYVAAYRARLRLGTMLAGMVEGWAEGDAPWASD